MPNGHLDGGIDLFGLVLQTKILEETVTHHILLEHGGQNVVYNLVAVLIQCGANVWGRSRKPPVRILQCQKKGLITGIIKIL